MRRGKLKPLDTSVWFAQVRRLGGFCSTTGSSCEAESQAIRRAYYLIQVAPLAIRRAPLAAASITETELEVLLDKGKTMQAALKVVTVSIELADKRSDQKEAQAALVLDETSVREFSAASSPLAVIGVWAEYISFAVAP